jgi:hypothetical protein
MHPSTIWRKVAKFRKMFGVHPDEAKFAGVSLDPKLFWNAAKTVGESSSRPPKAEWPTCPHHRTLLNPYSQKQE